MEKKRFSFAKLTETFDLTLSIQVGIGSVLLPCRPLPPFRSNPDCLDFAKPANHIELILYSLSNFPMTIHLFCQSVIQQNLVCGDRCDFESIHFLPSVAFLIARKWQTISYEKTKHPEFQFLFFLHDLWLDFFL